MLVGVYAHHLYTYAPGRQRALDCLELKSWVVVSIHVHSVNQARVFCKRLKCHKDYNYCSIKELQGCGETKYLKVYCQFLCRVSYIPDGKKKKAAKIFVKLTRLLFQLVSGKTEKLVGLAEV